MKSLILLLFTSQAIAQTTLVAPEYSVSVNGDTHYTAAQPSGGNIVLQTMNKQSAQTPLVKVPKSFQVEDLTITQSLTNTESFASYFNSVVKGPFASATTPMTLLIAKSYSGSLTYAEYEQIKIKSVTLPALNASTREVLNLTYTLSIGQQVQPKPNMPIKSINRPNAISSNFAFTVNSKNISTFEMSPITVNFAGETSTTSDVQKFKAIVQSNELTFFKDLQNKQLQNIGQANDLAEAKITYLNPSMNSALFTVNIHQLGVAAIRALPTTNAIQKYEIEFFASKIELIKN